MLPYPPASSFVSTIDCFGGAAPRLARSRRMRRRRREERTTSGVDRHAVGSGSTAPAVPRRGARLPSFSRGSMIITLMIVIGARERHRRHRDAHDERRDDARARATKKISTHRTRRGNPDARGRATRCDEMCEIHEIRRFASLFPRCRRGTRREGAAGRVESDKGILIRVSRIDGDEQWWWWWWWWMRTRTRRRRRETSDFGASPWARYRRLISSKTSSSSSVWVRTWRTRDRPRRPWRRSRRLRGSDTVENPRDKR